MPWWGWISLVVGVIGGTVGTGWAIDAWLLPSPWIRPRMLRLFGKVRFDPITTPLTEETGRRMASGIERIAEYLDGLPQAVPKIRNPFLEAQELEKEHKYREAIKRYEACFQTETTNSQRSALHILIGNCFMSLSELEEAEGHYKEAEAASKETADKKGLAVALGNLGIVYGQKGELDKALEYFQQAQNIDIQIGYLRGQANNLGNLGNVYLLKGELDKALEHFQQVLSIYIQISDPLGKANALGNLGLVYIDKGELDKAQDHLQQALKIDIQTGNLLGQANDLGNLGIVYRQKGDVDKALEHHQNALKIDIQICNLLGQAQTLVNLGIVYMTKGELDKALDHFQQSLDIFQQIGAKLEIEKAKQGIKLVQNEKNK